MEIFGLVVGSVWELIFGYLIPFIFVLAIVIFVHEMGHFLVGRWCGVGVDAFSIGFGPELFGWTDRLGTRWKISSIPLGGYVKMFGDADASSRPDGRPMSEAEKAVSFHHKTVGQRAAIVFAGPFVNFIFAIIVLTLLFSIGGQPYTPAVIGHVAEDGAGARAGLEPGDEVISVNGVRVQRFEEMLQIVSLRPDREIPIVVERDGRQLPLTVVPAGEIFKDRHGNDQVVGSIGVGRRIAPVVGRVVDDSAAARAGLREGDEILGIDGRPVHSFEDIRRIVAASAGRPLPIEVRRGDRRIEVTATPDSRTITGEDGREQAIGVLGVGAEPPPRRVHDPLTASWEALREIYAVTVATGTAIGQMFSGTRSTKDLGGPLRIAEMSGDMAQRGLYAFVWFLGILSLHLCLINLLPVPMLDGGHLLFYAIEAARRKPLSERAQEYGFRIGLALVITLMVFVTWNDFSYFFGSFN